MPILSSTSLVLAAALAQVQSSSSGWSLQDSLKAADVIVTGELAEPSAVDSGDSVRVSGSLRIANVIKGDLAIGSSIPLRWQYQPGPGDWPATTTKVPPLFGLWLLKRGGGNGYEPLRVSMTFAPHGGYVMPLPNHVPVLYGDTPEAKLAGTLGESLITIANAKGAQLNPERSPNAGERVSRELMEYREIAGFLMMLEPKDTAPVFETLARAAEPNLRVLGYAGRIRKGDIATLRSLEREATLLAPTLESGQIAQAIMSIPRVDDPALVEALGELAIADPWPGVGAAAASRISFLSTPAGLPYSAVMLENRQYQGFGIGGFCSLMRSYDSTRRPPLAEFWNDDTRRHCDAGTGEEHVAFWKIWWQANRGRVEQIHGRPLARPQRPKWAAAAQPQTEPVQASMTTRLRSFVFSTLSWREAARQSGAQVPEKLFGPPYTDEDASRLEALVMQLNTKLEELRARDMKYINSRRVQNEPPDPEMMKKFWQENEDTVAQALERAKTELSPDGWAKLERALMAIGMVGARVGAKK